MGNLSLPLKFAVFLTFSLSASTATSSQFVVKSSQFVVKSQSPSPNPKATPSDLLSILGPATESSKINPLLFKQFKSCLKFLVPFTPNNLKFNHQRRSIVSPRLATSNPRHLRFRSRGEEEENELVWWPPEPVLELARLAVDSGGDPGAIHRALDPTPLPVPDVEGSKDSRCQLTRTPYGRRFISEELNSYVKFLFQVIAARGPSIGLNVSLNSFDFFHGHMFLAKETGRLGILFHAKEYPAYDKKAFPYNMGFCQRGSDVPYDNSMNLRNILWLAPFPSNSSTAWLSPEMLPPMWGLLL
ncbi:uncharacterized protein LOC126675101 isoform X2 [Mercurialis annua]|uniref:uncharacterized protein LOC126675101 isoform X2 n=1 Tax=Mercurialis annua TaxID=3986 RepID=UPI00215E1DDC|nr:uncharacterized protein LOC126675101 isoform X2 [Mercurialis annua]